MTGQSPQFERTPPGEPERLCVLLVGHDPIEQRLRRDGGIALFRARSALEAVGEAGTVAGLTNGTPRVIVVAPGALNGQDDADRWLRALREVDPGTPVLAIVSAGAGANGAASIRGVDGWLNTDADADSLRAAIGGRGGTRGPASVTPVGTPAAEAGRSAQQAAPAAEVVRALAGGLEDERIVLALLGGTEIIGPCLDVLRRRLGGESFRFVSVKEAVHPPDAGPGQGVVEVGHRGKRFGWLIGASTSGIQSGAHWLSRWLALGEQHTALRTAAFTDPLTGAWNRRYLDRFLRAAVDRARERRHDVTLLLFDIDDFKRYNDAYGHPAGDEILIETVRLLNSVIRPTDRVARIGGDEFAVVFDDPAGPRDPASRHPSSIVEIAKRFQRQILEHRFPKLGECARGSLTISGGLATFPWDAHDAVSLLEHADRLILESKGEGKNIIRIGAGAQRALGCEDRMT